MRKCVLNYKIFLLFGASLSIDINPPHRASWISHYRADGRSGKRPIPLSSYSVFFFLVTSPPCLACAQSMLVPFPNRISLPRENGANRSRRIYDVSSRDGALSRRASRFYFPWLRIQPGANNPPFLASAHVSSRIPYVGYF